MTKQKANIVVVGSLNVDLVVEVDKKPKLGETLLGNSFQTFLGGKGANQCVAASKLDGNCTMIGKVGEDEFGRKVIDNLSQLHITAEYISKSSTSGTGIALIEVVNHDNSIIVVPGANMETDIPYVSQFKECLLNSDIVVLQLEIPLTTVEWIVDFLWEHQKKVILNPAPAVKLPQSIIDKVTYITPNEHECAIVFGNDETLIAHMKKYPNKLIVTEGEKGIRFYDGNDIQSIPTKKVEVVDTTGAGDTFNGALAVFIAEGMTLKHALEHACIAGALSVTKLGAQKGMPTRSELSENL